MQTSNTSRTSSHTPEAIATAAYYHWINAGKPAGRDQEFWLKAETELKSPGGATTNTPAKLRTKPGTEAAGRR